MKRNIFEVVTILLLLISNDHLDINLMEVGQIMTFLLKYEFVPFE